MLVKLWSNASAGGSFHVFVILCNCTYFHGFVILCNCIYFHVFVMLSDVMIIFSNVCAIISSSAYSRILEYIDRGVSRILMIGCC